MQVGIGGIQGVPDATSTTKGKLKTSTSTTVNTGTATDEAVTPDALAGSYFGRVRKEFMVFAPETNVASGNHKAFMIANTDLNGMNLVDAFMGSFVSGQTGTMTVQINRTRTVSKGDSTTQFDITNPSGTTFRYTWDGTGTNPNISDSKLSVQVGDYAFTVGANFAAGNYGVFVVTGVGANYFEVNNAGGAVESDKTLGAGGLFFNTLRDVLSTAMTQTLYPNSKYAGETPMVIDTDLDDVQTGDVLTVDVRTIHSTPATGLYVEIQFALP